ncbi:glycosyltransferase family 2 protein [Aliarcobacter butzleri]|uniref:glycosyltransferase family 2 protein n=1 Tax=Aliarcobacter butzleri TaxID=28197 RepID=UPI0021B3A958|nr:glycosyltransferase family 2 protein [Aliarcobacter butzleri]MCT7552715.1 glycosyltransferase family 2 protein [Aliarcobacter butzleri]
MNIEPKIGLVTVLYNGIEVLEGFFESLAKQTYKNYVLYVIDNSPNEDTLNEAKRLSENYLIPSEFIYNNANLGVAKGNNQGIELSLESGCDFVLLLNNDIEFGKDTIKNMVIYAVDNNEKIIIPKIYYYKTNIIWMAGGYVSKIKALTPHRGYKEKDIGQYDNIEYIKYATTCFMLINKEVFNNVGLMDEKYFVYYDDTDFIWRAYEEGYKILYYPKVCIEHRVSFSTGGEKSSFSIYYTNRNRVYFIRKNFPFFYQLASLSYFFATRIINIFIYSKDERKHMIKGFFDGWKLK